MVGVVMVAKSAALEELAVEGIAAAVTGEEDAEFGVAIGAMPDCIKYGLVFRIARTDVGGLKAS
jgi:hypothetical protein